MTVMLSAVPPATVQLTEHAVMVAAPSVTLDWLALGASGVPVAENEAPGVPVDIADTEFAPAVVPTRHDVNCANPLTSVDRFAGAGRMLPPPPDTLNVTPALWIGLPARSVICTRGALATLLFTVALWRSPAILKI